MDKDSLGAMSDADVLDAFQNDCMLWGEWKNLTYRTKAALDRAEIERRLARPDALRARVPMPEQLRSIHAQAFNAWVSQHVNANFGATPDESEAADMAGWAAVAAVLEGDDNAS